MRRLITTASALIALALGVASADAQDRGALDRQFRGWLEETVWPEAAAKGVGRATFERAFAGVGLNLKLPNLKLPGQPEAAESWQQAEFRAPGRYFSEREITTMVALGRKELARWKSALDQVEARYGVPRGIVVAIWAKESAFGRADIPHNAIEILATQAFLGRRKDAFRTELVAALIMLEQDHFASGTLKSSWAGALGQPQFLPSKFLAYAVDGDGDGKRDIWASVPDTLGSIANYLKEHGWRSGRDWGFEARIPETITCAQEGPDNGFPIATWVEHGVTRVSGRPFPDHEVPEPGYLLMPAGRFGPAFIATENFYVLKEYNESDLYALYVGHLADRFAGGGAFVAGWNDVGGFSRGAVQAMQVKMEEMGYDVGGADGLIGFKTRRSVGEYQARNGLSPTCFPDAALIRKIG